MKAETKMKRAPFAQLFGIWCYDLNNHKGDWMRDDADITADAGISAFPTARMAQRRARRSYGFQTYSDAKREGWVEVRPLTPTLRR